MTINENIQQPQRPHIYAVSELNQNIKQLLEEKFPFIWISGEISNFKTPSSGHCYFTLKDQHAQVSAVIFRTQARSLKFQPEDGMSIVGLGRVGVYEPRGTYQIIFEYVEPKGVGALQIAFEKLKQKLADEGLFDAQHKQSLPLLPRKISVVTSPTGAAVRDFINVAQRRFSNLPLEVVPVTVQGARAPLEIIHAIDLLNRLASTDIIVLARGGGSIEDLCAFNDERLARCIFASSIPIVSAVGHETDFTIADFVADLRAPTPSASAEIVVPSKKEFLDRLKNINLILYKNIFNTIKLLNNTLSSFSDRMVHPKRRLEDMHLRLDELSMRMTVLIGEHITRRRERVGFHRDMLMQVSPAKLLTRRREQILAFHQALVARMERDLSDNRADTTRQAAMLNALNPMAILNRGYSITRDLPSRAIIRTAEAVDIGKSLEILLGSGRLTVSVEDRQTDP